MDQEYRGGLHLTFDLLKVKQSITSERNNQTIKTLFADLKLGCQSQRFNRRHISDTPYLWPYLQTPGAIGGREQASIPGAQPYVPFGISSTYLLQIPYLSLSCTVCDSEIWVFVDRNS